VNTGYNFSESTKSRMQRLEEQHASREPQFGHPSNITSRSPSQPYQWLRCNRLAQ